MQKSDKDENLIDSILAQTQRKEADVKISAEARSAVESLVEDLIKPKSESTSIKSTLISKRIAEIDAEIDAQIDEIIHHNDFRKLEAAWRGLKLLIYRTNFRENIAIEIINVSKSELNNDFKEQGDVTKTAFYKLIYTDVYENIQGKPIGAVIGNYTFDYSNEDIGLLKFIAAAGTMAHTPFIASASPQIFDLNNFSRLNKLDDLHKKMAEPQYAQWNKFRHTEEAKTVGLTLPGFLLRLPYDKKSTKTFNYEETVLIDRHEDYLWGNSSFAFAIRLVDSFSKFGLCSNISGLQGGAGLVEDLPVPLFKHLGNIEARAPIEGMIHTRLEMELSQEGFIPLTMIKDTDRACFFSSNALYKPVTKVLETTEQLPAKTTNQFSYLFILNRFSQYIKVMCRDRAGERLSRIELEAMLNQWIFQYIEGSGICRNCPLKDGSITIEEGDNSSWYTFHLTIQPFFAYEGEYFSISGKLEKW